jgi:hypothetical protein
VHLSELDDDGGGSSDGVRHDGGDQEVESRMAASRSEPSHVRIGRGR